MPYTQLSLLKLRIVSTITNLQMNLSLTQLISLAIDYFNVGVKVLIMILLSSQSTLAASSTIHAYQLANGLKLLVKEDHRAPIVNSQLWYHVGSSYEPQGFTGISHVLEHMMFKGTAKHPAGTFSREVAHWGGEENAATGEDITFYYQEIPAKALTNVLALEADRMANLSITEQAFKKEIQVVMEERRLRVDNDPIATTIERFNATAFVANPYHHPVVGWMNELTQLKYSDVQRWYQQWYGPNNATLVIIGDVKPTEVYTQVKKYFGALPSISLPDTKRYQSLKPLGVQRIMVNRPAKVPFLILGFHTPSVPSLSKPSNEPYALEVLYYLLVGSDSARLPQNLIRAHPLASVIEGNYDLYSRLPGLFTLTAIPATQHSLQEVETALILQLNKVKKQGVTPDELKRIKAQITAHHVYAQDSMAYQVLGNLSAVGLPWTEINHYLQQIQKVSAKDVQEVAIKYLNENYLTVAWLIPTALK